MTASGGLLLQILPKAARDESLIEILEARVGQLTGFTPLLRAGKTLPDILEELLGDLNLVIFPEVQMVRFDCHCSFDRLLGALKMLGEGELLDMIEKDEGAEATCQFCGEVYQASKDQLRQLVEDLEQQKANN